MSIEDEGLRGISCKYKVEIQSNNFLLDGLDIIGSHNLITLENFAIQNINEIRKRKPNHSYTHQVLE